MTAIRSVIWRLRFALAFATHISHRVRPWTITIRLRRLTAIRYGAGWLRMGWDAANAVEYQPDEDPSDMGSSEADYMVEDQ